MSEKQFSKSHIKNSPCYAIFTLHTLLCSSTQVTHSFFFSPLDLRANKLFPHAIQPLCDIDIWHIPLNICSSHACNRLLSRTLISSKSDTFYFVSASSTWAPQFFRYSAPILLSAYHHARMYRKNILWEVFFLDEKWNGLGNLIEKSNSEWMRGVLSVFYVATFFLTNWHSFLINSLPLRCPEFPFNFFYPN
jgi:hypothetical protein